MKVMAGKAFRLGIIGAIAALLLAVVNNFTEPVIENFRQQELNEALASLAGGGNPGVKEENPADAVVSRWPIEPDGGWILEIVGRGYGGAMTIVASYNPNGAVIAARLMDNDETVGFGKKAEETGYMEIFVGKGGDDAVPLTKSELGDRVDVVSGATVTFSGISQAIAAGSDLVKVWGDQ